MDTEAQDSRVGADAGHEKCPSCGAELTYSPEEGRLVCPYCGYKQTPGAEKESVPIHDLTGTGERPDWGGETVTAHCNNCGADITVDPGTAAQVCAFCGSPMVIREEDPSLSPDGVLPFHFARKAAEEAFDRWIRGKFFSPRALHTQSKMQRLSGVYIPHFAFDCKTTSHYTAQAGTYYYVTEPVTVTRDGKQVQEMQEVRHVRWTPVEGTYNGIFGNRLVNASKNVDRKLIRLQFDLRGLKKYKKDYLLGFMAENASIGRDECWDTARHAIEDDLRGDIRSSIHADEVQSLNFSTSYRDVKYRYLLLPIWISVYTFRGRTYKFMVNGQTGEVRGQAPVSPLRILVSILLTAGVPALLYFLVNHTLGIVVFVVAGITLLVLANKKPK